jgi:hypothetical protein
MRAFDGKPGAEVLSEGHRVHYNLVREHEATGMTPGEAAGIPMPDGMRWKTIIERASRARRGESGIEAPLSADGKTEP